MEEAFDLRLTVLRLIRNFKWILLVTAAGSLLFGGLYYVKNNLLVADTYAVTLTCKIVYTDPPTKSGDYYINSATWDSYVDTDAFRAMLADTDVLRESDLLWTDEELMDADLLSATVASDITVPSVTVTTPDPARTETLADAAAEVLTGPWAESLDEVTSITVLDRTNAALVVDEFYRPVRAFILGAILGAFAAVVVFLLHELSVEGIWLPATLRRKYGLTALGTVHSGELAENFRYHFVEVAGRMRQIAVCPMDDAVNPEEVCEALRQAGVLCGGQELIPVPAPTLGPESVRSLRGMDGILLVVPAGSGSGKPLEHVLEYLTEQEVRVTAALLWDADEWLIRCYYRFGV